MSHPNFDLMLEIGAPVTALVVRSKEKPGDARAKELMDMYHNIKTQEQRREVLRTWLENPDFDNNAFDEIFTFTTRSTKRTGGEWIPEQELRKKLGAGFKTAIKEGHYDKRVITTAAGMKSPSGALEYRKTLDRDFKDEVQEKRQRVIRTKDGATEDDLARVTRQPIPPVGDFLPLVVPPGSTPKVKSSPKRKLSKNEGHGATNHRTKTKEYVTRCLGRFNKLLMEVPSIKAEIARMNKGLKASSRMKGVANECLADIEKKVLHMRKHERKLTEHLGNDEEESFIVDATTMLTAAEKLEQSLDL